MNEIFSMWTERFSRCKDYYEKSLGDFDKWEALYGGSNFIKKNPNKPVYEKEIKASNVQNIAYELVESQIDSNIPMPKVDTLCKEDEGSAVIIEEMLKAQLNKMPMEVFNDLDERVCYINGGSWYWVEWDNTKKTHNTTGDVVVTLLHPKQVIPQAGITDWKKSEYIFLMITQTQEYIKRRYGIDVSEENDSLAEDNKENGLVTQVICYFRNEKSGIGIISWVNDVLLEYMEDYQARKQEICVSCGTGKMGEECVCGERKFKQADLDYEEVSSEFSDNIRKSAATSYYKPEIFPLVLRKNVSEFGKVLGASDIEKIRDQQNALNKLNTVIEEKLFSGGSYVMLPEKKNVETNDSQLKIVRVKPEEANMFKLFNVQPDMNWELRNKQENYKTARDTLGITDSFQGKPDATAQSGKAKEISARQSAGRLDSKRRMKDAAYAELFELIFKFMLAYADEPRALKAEEKGEKVYRQFNRYDFLNIDDAGEMYYNDDFLFSTDAAGALGSDRVYMWEQARINLQSGVYGNPSDLKTLLRFWTTMDSFHYPTAKTVRAWIEEDLAEQKFKEEQAAIMGNMSSPVAQRGMQGAQGDTPLPPMLQGGQMPQGDMGNASVNLRDV